MTTIALFLEMVMKFVACPVVIASLVAITASAQESAKQPKKFPSFTESDTDKDGFLTQAEWDASGRSPGRVLRVDADKDGKVSRAELHQATAAARAAAENQPKP